VKKALFAACALLAGCAAPPLPKPVESQFNARAAVAALSIGQSTKADVRAALGEAVVVDFPTGYEVWVYRERQQESPPEKSKPPGAELVLLFAPSGILAKTRVR
jgi:outer membrane protein assembly factor BamE (lipoprotein component of BamABCDE complex)